MKTIIYTLGILLTASVSTLAQNVGINTDGSNPDADAVLHVNRTTGVAVDSALIRVENEDNGATNVTGLQFLNSATGSTSRWSLYNPGGGSTDFRINNNGTDRVTIQNDGDVGIGTTSPASGLDIQSSMGYKVNTITSATTLDNTHNVVLCNTGPYTVTLPAAANNTGKVYYIKNIDSDGDYFTIDGNSTETIDGDETFELLAYNHAVRIISDGSNWHVLDEVGKENKDICGTYFDFTWRDVTDPATGLTWMDRNLGAQRVALSSTDDKAFGDLYQFGRGKDGHQCRTAVSTSIASTTNTPGHSAFIWTNPNIGDWRTPVGGAGWVGANNPCPNGYRVPTLAEWDAEITALGITDKTTAAASILKLPSGGYRGSELAFSSAGFYASTDRCCGIKYRAKSFHSGSVMTWDSNYDYSTSIRCIKDY